MPASLDTFRDWIDLITLADAQRLEREARELVAAGHDPDDLTIAWRPLTGERAVVPKSHIQPHPLYAPARAAAEWRRSAV